MYQVAGPSEVLAITGSYIQDIKLAKKKFVYPGQKCIRVDISPVNYTFDVQAMSAEKLSFVLPAVFTIGPRVDDHESMLKYAKLISSHDKLSSHVQELVKGVIEGETRVLAASMTMEEIFKGTKEFKQEVFNKIYNANVKQLVDVPGHEYFSYLGQKTQMEAAKVDVAEARMKGEIGAKERDGLTVQNAAKIDNETKISLLKGKAREEVRVKTEVQIFENQRKAEVVEANTELAKKKATRTEKLKAENLSKASVEYDIKQAANAELYAKQREAEGIVALAQAQGGSYLRELLAAVNGDYKGLRDFIMIDRGIPQEMARLNASAVQGLQPKISIWSGANGDQGGGAMKDVAGVYKMLPPLFQTVHEQTGMQPPAWLGSLATSNGAN
ncbi:LOW QUALITY PROTEIN: hypothetical protein RJ639_018656 [Escallonia herrerae]|uniref:Flotillin-like n=1 Tax=Escallonia herrerae TaxID=1293975 RepID=A0AA89AKV7_9ASTE|nr:LOW QUALITY PROTEIN: hypothetical protein RJ639_018656 [Escallonia herrerae]